MSQTATATSPLDGLEIHHDSEVRVEETYVGDDDQQLHDVVLDGEPVGSGLLRDDADHVAADIERRIKRAQLVHGIRQMADFVEQRPDLPLDGAHAFVSFYGDDARRRLVDVAEQLGEYEASVDEQANVRLKRHFDGGADVWVYGYRAALPEPQSMPVYELPALPGRNLAAEPEAAAA